MQERAVARAYGPRCDAMRSTACIRSKEAPGVNVEGVAWEACSNQRTHTIGGVPARDVGRVAREVDDDELAASRAGHRRLPVDMGD
jgi:hypothetical protein